MHDINFIRKFPQEFDKLLAKRDLKPLSAEILKQDTELRALKTKSQELSAERNKIAKEIGNLKRNKQDATQLLEKVEQTKNQEAELIKQTKELEQQITDFLATIPNTPYSEVPYGTTEDENVLVKSHGTPKSFNFKPKEHYEIGANLGMMDFEKASYMSGSRFVILLSDLAKLERALATFMIDIHTKEHGYKELSVPNLVTAQALYNSSQLPKFKEDLFEAGAKHFLIPTSEVPLVNMVGNSIVKQQELPLRYTALSNCYRSEAGSAGRDTRGMIRLHQFQKVELVSITSHEESNNELERMLNCAEEVLKRLELPYQVVVLCSGDMGFSAKKTYDINVHLPGQNAYREISSCSNCGDFQAIRMKARYKNQESGETKYAHTLNGSGIAVGRALVAVLENYQQEDGSVIVPSALVSYMGGQTVIKAVK